MTQHSPPPLKITLPFTPHSVVEVLRWGAQPSTAPHGHEDIAQWCDRFWCQHLEDDPPEELARLLPVLTDVETQWDLYLANTFTVDELRTLSFAEVQLPVKWFQEWLFQAEAQPVAPADGFAAR